MRFRHQVSLSPILDLYDWNGFGVRMVVVVVCLCVHVCVCECMMTSSNGNIFCVTGPLCGEFSGHRWIPRTKASGAELCCFLWVSRSWWHHGNVFGVGVVGDVQSFCNMNRVITKIHYTNFYIMCGNSRILLYRNTAVITADAKLELKVCKIKNIIICDTSRTGNLKGLWQNCLPNEKLIFINW